MVVEERGGRGNPSRHRRGKSGNSSSSGVGVTNK